MSPGKCPHIVQRKASPCTGAVASAAALGGRGARCVGVVAVAAAFAAVMRHASHARSAARCCPMRVIQAGRAALSASTPAHCACLVVVGTC